jgi:hypothetical protein
MRPCHTQVCGLDLGTELDRARWGPPVALAPEGPWPQLQAVTAHGGMLGWPHIGKVGGHSRCAPQQQSETDRQRRKTVH